MLPIQQENGKPSNESQFKIQPVFPSSQLFGFMFLVTLALVYAKLSVHFYVNWTLIFAPLILFFTVKFLESLWLIRQVTQLDMSVPLAQLRLYIMWAIAQMLITGSLGAGTLYLGDLIQKEENYRNYHGSQGTTNNESSSLHESHDITEPLKHLFGTFAFAVIIYLGYSVAVDSVMSDQEELKGQQGAGQALINFLFSLLGNSVAVCSGGACNSFYVSTLSAFFSAFGISIAHYIHYLNFVCLFLLCFSLFTLYSAKNTWKYGPFLLTLVGALMITCDMFIYDLNMLNYIGNAGVIGAAIWNSRLNKFRFGRPKVRK